MHVVSSLEYISSSVLVLFPAMFLPSHYSLNVLQMNFLQDPVLDGLGCEHAEDRGCLHEWIWTPHHPQRDRKRRLAEWPHCRLPGETNPLDRCQVRGLSDLQHQQSFTYLDIFQQDSKKLL